MTDASSSTNQSLERATSPVDEIVIPVLIELEEIIEWIVDVAIPDKNPKEKCNRVLSKHFEVIHNPFLSALDIADATKATSASELTSQCIWNRLSAWQVCLVGKNVKYGPFETWKEYFCRYLNESLLVRATKLAIDDDLCALTQISPTFRLNDFMKNNPVLSQLVNDRLFWYLKQMIFDKVSLLAEVVSSAVEDSCRQWNDEALKKVSLFLLCKGKYRSARRLLSSVDSNEKVETVIAYMDHFLGFPLGERFHEIRSELGIEAHCRISNEQFEYGVIDLSKSFDVPQDCCRNIIYLELRKKIGFISHETFCLDSEMDVATFRELIDEFSEFDQRIPNLTVSYLLKIGVTEEAKFTAERFGLTDLLYSTAFSTISPEKKTPTKDHPPSKRSPKNHDKTLPEYELPIPYSSVHVIDESNNYHQAVEAMVKSGGPIGIDSEWPAVVLPGKRQIAAILQMAIYDQIFIFDLTGLYKVLPFKDWQRLRVEVFENPKLRKITFGFKTDSNMLSSSYPDAFGNMRVENEVDIESTIPDFWQSIRSSNFEPESPVFKSLAFAKASVNEIPPRSLVDVSQKLLGKRIVKNYRMSNWNRRPLDFGQILYAAVDSYSLLEIYDEMERLKPFIKTAAPESQQDEKA